MATSITNSREMDTVLPNRVNVTYLDVNREYDQNEQFAQRMTKESVNTTAIDLAIVMNATEAAQAAEVLLYMYWLERNDISFNLPPTYNNLEPGDVVTINANEGTYQVRLTEINYTGEGRLECKGKYSSAATYTSSASGGDGDVPESTIPSDGDSEMLLLDIPCLRDTYAIPGYVAAITGYSSGWPGGVLYRSDDEGQTWTSLQGFTSPGSEICYAIGTLSGGRTDIFDTVGSIQVAVVQGNFESVTELNVLNGVNWFAYGTHGRWEIIGVKTCLLQSDGTYIFRDFLRGRKGTEWAMTGHKSGDALVLLDSNTVEFISVNSSSIGVSRQYKAVTLDQATDEVDSTSFIYTGVNLECLSPIYLNGNRSNGNNWVLTWVRRSRIDVEWRDYVDVSVGETAENYIVELYSDATYTTLKHTSATLTSATYSYSAAQQATDFGSNQATLYCKIYQVSSVVGRGYPLTASITG